MPHPTTSRLAGSKRKLPFIDVEELVCRPEDVFHELKPDPPLIPARKRRISEWAQAYLRGEPIFIASAVLKGPFENSCSSFRGSSRRLSVETIPNSQEEIVESQIQAEVSVSKSSDKIGHEKPNGWSSDTADLQSSEDVVASIEGRDIDNREYFPSVRAENMKSYGGKATPARNVQTWPHHRRVENQMNRLAKFGRPYIQNTPWSRPKSIPPFDPTKAQALHAEIPQESSASDLGVLQQWLDSSSVVSDHDPRDEFTPALPNHEATKEAHPATPERQIIKIDSQFLVAIEKPELLRMDSCQTADLLDDSQLHPGDVHSRLQRVLGSSPPLQSRSYEHQELECPIEQQQDAVSSKAAHLPFPTLCSTQYPMRTNPASSETNILTSKNACYPDLVKLKQLEESIDGQLSDITKQSHYPGTVVLVSSSFDEESTRPDTQILANRTAGEPTHSASTDRIESSQPEERVSAARDIAPSPEPDVTPRSKPGKSIKQISFGQTSIKESFQVNKSFGSNGRSPSKTSLQSPKETATLNTTVADIRDVTTDISTPQSERRSRKQSSICVTKKGTLTYGKRRPQTSLSSSSKRASFLSSLPKSQRELQRAIVETHGYNYDVGDEFDLDGTVNELGSFLSSWDREIGT